MLFNYRNLIVLIIFYLLISCGGGGGGTTNNNSDTSEQTGIETASEVLYSDFGDRSISDYNLIDVANGTYDGIENFNLQTIKRSSIEAYLEQLNLDRDPLQGLSLLDYDYFVVIKIKPDCNWDNGPHWIDTYISGTEVYFDISYEVDHSLPVNGCEISTCEYHIYGFALEN